MEPRKMESPKNGTVPNPDPTDRTIEQLQREIATSREIVESKSTGNREAFETRLEGMDKAIRLLQTATDRIPGHVIEQVTQLRELHGERFSSVKEQMTIRFDSIATQFIERDKRTEQLSLADKTAIAAALQAQKEAAGATTEMVIAAITKMDTNFTKLIDQTQNLLAAGNRNTDDKINDLKGRFDRGEGRGSVSDPATAEMLARLNAGMDNLSIARSRMEGQGLGQREMIAWLIAGAGLLMGIYFKGAP